MSKIRMLVFALLLAIVACQENAQIHIENPSITQIDLIRTIAQSYGERLGFSGNVLIGQGDSIAYLESFGSADVEGEVPNTENTLFRIASVSKQLTAGALLALEQQAKVDFDEPIAKYLPNLKKEFGDEITIHHLLSHSSGLGRDIETYSDRPLGQEYIGIDDLVQIINGTDLEFAPGERWAYSNLGYALAAKIIENVTGKPFSEAMEESLFQPLGMENTRHEVSGGDYMYNAQGKVGLPDKNIASKYEDKSYVVGAGSIQTTSKDLFRWARAVMSDGFLDESSRVRLFSKQAGNYSYGWFVSNYVWPPVAKGVQGQNIHHDGGSPGFSAKISLLKEHDIVIIILSNQLPSPVAELSNVLTNLSVGFEDESPAKPDGTKEYFETLFSGSAKDVMTLTQQWKVSGKKRIPSQSDVFLIGKGYLENTDYEKGYMVMDFLSEIYPEWSFPPLFKAFAKEEQGLIDEAKMLYKKVLEIEPNQSNAMGRLERLQKREGTE